MNKKRLKISLTIIILIIIASIGFLSFLRYYAPLKHDIVYSENLNKKDLDLVLSDYIKNNYFNWSNVSSREKYEAHKIYGIDEKFGLKYVYMYTFFEAGNSGGSNPLVIIVKENSDGTYSVVNHKEPKDGDEYRLSLKIIFPHKYYLAAINSTETAKELKKEIDSPK